MSLTDQSQLRTDLTGTMEGDNEVTQLSLVACTYCTIVNLMVNTVTSSALVAYIAAAL